MHPLRQQLLDGNRASRVLIKVEQGIVRMDRD